MPAYTDIDNTGTAAVPDIGDDIDQRESYDETVLSHRLTTDE